MNKPPKNLKQELLKGQFRKVKSYFSFGKLKTLEDLLLLLGHSKGELEYIYGQEQLKGKITYAQIEEQEKAYKARAEQDTYCSKTIEPFAHEYEGVRFNPNKKDTLLVPVNSDIFPYLPQPHGHLDVINNAPQSNDDSPLASPKQSAKLFKFQNKAAHLLLDGIRIHHKRAQLLRAAVGTGKTFVIGAVLRQLLDTNFIAQHKSVSPWPIAWITRSSIVEQTKRVCENLFGIDLDIECCIINIEQLRSKFGEWMVDCTTTVSRGEEHITWTWKPKYHPLLFIIDESQLAKNEDSTQSKIIQALAKIPEEDPVYIICVSATPFTRVIEAKYFAVNTWKEL